MVSTFPICLSVPAPALCATSGASLSSQKGCARRLLLGHMKHTGSQQRELSAAIHAPFQELEPVHLPFDWTSTPRQGQSCQHRRFVAVRIPLANDSSSGKRLAATSPSQVSNCCP